MAASVLLGSADNTGLNFIVGGSGGGGGGNVLVGNNNGLGPVGPAPWNRSLDRALDEASATGCLNLSGRKLKEFPRSAANHDLTDTTRADLSRNRLSELPLDVCVFVSLESLNLYQNCLRTLPDSLLNLQALTYLNLSRNQLSVLPPVVCSLPLKVLIACNNKLVSLPEELGQLRHLTELDVSCNEIQTLPSQVGQLEALRDLNIRRNHLVRLPPELSELPLVRLDFSCNKVTSIPVCYRRLTQLQTIVLDNNPLQTPPAQICIKGKVHIFKYLNLEATKTTPDLPDYDRRPLTFSSCVDELYPGRPYGALDSGFNSVDSGDKRWSGNEATEELSEMSRDPRLRRDDGRGGGGALTNGSCEYPDQIDFIDSCVGEEEDDEGRRSRGGGGGDTSLSSQFMAYIERRITREVRAPPPLDWDHCVCVPVCLSVCVQNVYPSRRSTHTDDSALFMVSIWTHPQTPGSGVLPVYLFQNIEARLKVSLPSDLGAALTDGVVLCHLANHVRPRSVPSIHVPSPAVPKLTMAKCRRNVENFLEACRRIGVPQSQLCLPLHILEERGLPQVAGTVSALLELAPPRHSVTSTSATTTTPTTSRPSVAM
uniref:Leucine-rich repeats and calponin homology (CH) domain containing 3 n=1 Tax=Sphaeramia orbicularis TaxID=375764 RepID=A0A672Z956_9TELE